MSDAINNAINNAKAAKAPSHGPINITIRLASGDVLSFLVDEDIPGRISDQLRLSGDSLISFYTKKGLPIAFPSHQFIYMEGTSP